MYLNRQYPMNNTSYSYFDARQSTNQLEKLAVAKHIHENMLQKLDAVFMDGGSACCAIAKEMAEGGKGHFTVVTNNMRALHCFMENRTIRVIVTGGLYVVEDEALVGKEAKLDFDQYSFRYAIVGASAIDSHFVYNHGIVGEEEIKRNYWKIPAEDLIVPANLGKFARKDLICFGRLYREAANVDEGMHSGRDLAQIAADELEKVRSNDQRQPVGGVLHPAVTGFGGNRCTIVIEPKWMIDQNRDFDCNGNLRGRLLEMVERINQRKDLTGVEVVFANVAKGDLSKGATLAPRARLKGEGASRTRQRNQA